MPTEAELRLLRCCFTGHRPEKITLPENLIILKLKKSISKAIQDGYTTFITGMARGVDIWAAEVVIEFRNSGIPIKLICACPFKGFELNWSKEWQSRYNAILKESDLVRYVNDKYSKACFQIRNEWMVNHSSRVIAVYNGETGGTRNTILYARKHDIEIENILDNEKPKP